MKFPRIRFASRKGFTLIELLTVIAIIGILAGMAGVAIPMVKKRAAMMDASNNARQIAIGYNAYANGGNTTRNISMENSGSVTKWAVFLTKKNPELNKGSLWFIANDDRLDNVSAIPDQVINSATKAEDPAFVAATPKSWAVVANAPRSADSNYPILWTRGLLDNGNWSTTAPWKDTGGHIAFMDGRVEWFDSLLNANDKGVLIDFTTKQPTASIQAAIGQNARKLEDQ